MFASIPDLNVHTRQWHPFKELKRTALSVEFGLQAQGKGRTEEVQGGSFEAGLAGRARGGEWQLRVQELEDRRRQEQERQLGGDVSDNAKSAVNPADFVTVGLNVAAAPPEEYPALVAPASRAGGIGWGGRSSGSRGGAEDFPALSGSRSSVPRPSGAPPPAPVMQGPAGPGLSFGLSNSRQREKEFKKAQAKREAEAVRQAQAVQTFKQAATPNEGGSLAVRLHRGEVASDHGATVVPAPAPAAPKAKVVSLSAARSRNSAATAMKAMGSGSGWAAALGSMGVQSVRAAVRKPLASAPPAPKPASRQGGGPNSSEADKPAPPLQSFDLRSLLPPGLADAGDDGFLEYSEAEFEANGRATSWREHPTADFPELPAPAPRETPSVHAVDSGATAAARLAGGASKGSGGRKRTKQELQALAFMR